MDISNFVFTINNYTDDTINLLGNFDCEYMIYGREIAPTTLTPHLQGYCELKKKMKFTALLKKFIQGAHIEKRKGSQIQAIDYCKKENNFTERGTPKKQGARNDIHAIRDMIVNENVNKVKDCIENMETMNFQTLRIVDRLLPMYETKRDWKPYVYWLYGNAGTGKTRFAYKILGKDCYTMNYSSRFFLDYDANENVLYDDFRINSIHFNELLRQLDRYQYKVEIKGGSRQFVPRVICITSDRPPWELWFGNDYSQIFRRLDSIYKLDISKK